MALVDELLERERRLWTGDAEGYRRGVDDERLVALGTMAGVMSRDEVASTVGGGPRWSAPTASLKGLLQPTRDFAVLTYEARATRQSKHEEPYTALVTSGYVRHGQEWKLAFHQQTRCPDTAPRHCAAPSLSCTLARWPSTRRQRCATVNCSRRSSRPRATAISSARPPQKPVRPG